MSYYREALENWLGTLSIKADKVADVGGKDKPMDDRRAKSWEVKRTIEYDLPDFDLNKDLIYNDCDVLFCLEVFEYIYDPVRAITSLAALCKKGATLYISFPFIYPHHQPLGMDYLRYTRSGIIKLCDIAGLTIMDLEERLAKVPETLLDFYKTEGMHVGGDSTVTGFLLTAKK